MDERFDLSRLTRTMQNAIIEHKEFSDINVPRFQEACFSGNLAVAKSIAANFTAEEATLGKNWALRYACAGGHLKVVIWMVEQFRLSIQDIRTNENQAFRWACSEGHLSVASWLVDRYGLTADDVQSVRNYALRISCENNHVSVVRWILKKFTIPDNVPRDNNYEILKFAYANSHYEIAKIITTTFNIHPDELSLFGASLVMNNSDDIFARIDAMSVVAATAATAATTATQKPPPNIQYSWWNPLYYIYGNCPDEEDNVVVIDMYSDIPAMADIADDSDKLTLPVGDRIVLELRAAEDDIAADASDVAMADATEADASAATEADAADASDDASSGDSDSDSESDSDSDSDSDGDSADSDSDSDD